MEEPEQPIVDLLWFGLPPEYRVDGKLGEGAYGVVFLAMNLTLDEKVAVKILKYPQEELRYKRFRKEATLVSKLSHDAIVRVKRIGVTNRHYPFIVYEFVDGVTLKERLLRGVLSESEFQQIFVHLLAGLDCAHAAGIIHRDLKPGNIMLVCDREGHLTAKILDFGIAKAVSSEDQRLTHSQDVIGTPEYMSPEQCKKLELDARSDLYSLACIMYESITGKPPFRGDSALDTIFKQVNSDPAELVAREWGLPDGLAKLIMRNLSKAPDLRSSSAVEMQQAIQQLSGWRTSGGTSWKYRQRWASSLVIVSLLSLICLITINHPVISTRPNAPLKDSGRFVDRSVLREPASADGMHKRSPTAILRNAWEQHMGLVQGDRAPRVVHAREQIIAEVREALSKLVVSSESQLIRFCGHVIVAEQLDQLERPSDLEWADAMEACKINGVLSEEAFTPLFWLATKSFTEKRDKVPVMRAKIQSAIDFGIRAHARSLEVPDQIKILISYPQGLGRLYHMRGELADDTKDTVADWLEARCRFGMPTNRWSGINEVELISALVKAGERDRARKILLEDAAAIQEKMNRSPEFLESSIGCLTVGRELREVGCDEESQALLEAGYAQAYRLSAGRNAVALVEDLRRELLSARKNPETIKLKIDQLQKYPLSADNANKQAF